MQNNTLPEQGQSGVVAGLLDLYVQVHNHSTGSSKFTLICGSTYLKKKQKVSFWSK